MPEPQPPQELVHKQSPQPATIFPQLEYSPGPLKPSSMEFKHIIAENSI